MAFAIEKKRLLSKPALIGISAGLALWLALVAGLMVVPLDKGESNQGIYALIGTLMPYETEDGERSAKQVHRPR